MASTTVTAVALTLESENSIVQEKQIQDPIEIVVRNAVASTKESKKDVPRKTQTTPLKPQETPVKKEEYDGTHQELKRLKQLENTTDEHQEIRIKLDTMDQNKTDLAKTQPGEDGNFKRLPKPQQDILLIHGPGQRYRLDSAGDIPDLKSDREILVQASICCHTFFYLLTKSGNCNWVESCRLERTVSEKISNLD